MSHQLSQARCSETEGLGLDPSAENVSLAAGHAFEQKPILHSRLQTRGCGHVSSLSKLCLMPSSLQAATNVFCVLSREAQTDLAQEQLDAADALVDAGEDLTVLEWESGAQNRRLEAMGGGGFWPWALPTDAMCRPRKWQDCFPSWNSR